LENRVANPGWQLTSSHSGLPEHRRLLQIIMFVNHRSRCNHGRLADHYMHCTRTRKNNCSSEITRWSVAAFAFWTDLWSHSDYVKTAFL